MMILMMIFRFNTMQRFLLVYFLWLMTGCAEFAPQAPAPVYSKNAPIYNNKPAPQQPSVTTEPLKNDAVIKAQPLPAGEKLLTPTQEQELSSLQKNMDSSLTVEQRRELVEFQRKLDAMLEDQQEQEKPKPKPLVKVPESELESVAETSQTQTVEPVRLNVPFQPLESFSAMSPAVNSLVTAANEDSQKGNEDAARANLERASRIEPRNAALYYKMALLKLKTDPSAAENLAKKSAILAGGDSSLKRHSWLLIAKARELQKNSAGAQEARDKASKF